MSCMEDLLILCNVMIYLYSGGSFYFRKSVSSAISPIVAINSETIALVFIRDLARGRLRRSSEGLFSKFVYRTRPRRVP